MSSGVSELGERQNADTAGAGVNVDDKVNSELRRV